jgi:hypothetical protein
MNPFTEQDFDTLYDLVFQTNYPGYKPHTKEVPNGDGLIDLDKRYAHVADKYLATLSPASDVTDTLYAYLQRAHDLATQVAHTLEVPSPFLPYRPASALRVLEYPVGALSHRHTDFDLFTVSLYRSEPARLILGKETIGSQQSLQVFKARRLSPGLHIGELGELIGLGYATPHHVEASTFVQKSIVYFALPHPEAKLPKTELTAGQWLAERYSRSRVDEVGDEISLDLHPKIKVSSPGKQLKQRT